MLFNKKNKIKNFETPPSDGLYFIHFISSNVSMTMAMPKSKLPR